MGIQYLQLYLNTLKQTLTHTGLSVLRLLVALLTETSEGTQSVLTVAMRTTQSLIESALIDICRAEPRDVRAVLSWTPSSFFI